MLAILSRQWLSRNLILVVLIGLGITLPTHANQKLPKIKPVMSCTNISKLDFSHENIGADVKINATSELKTAQGTFCKVSATLSPSIGVEVALPETNWTQRMLQVGCGGLCGKINLSLSSASGCIPAMNGEFTVAATDMGHSSNMMDASWAEDPQRRIDFAYRANHVTAEFTKALIKAFYGQQQKFAYFMGCSDGGREALIEAQRYPHDFNGISAGAPAAWFTTQNSFYHGWNVTANQRPDGTYILLQNRLPLIYKAALAHCPTLSGLRDGLLTNPFTCHFSRSWIKICKDGLDDQKNCLTTEELDVVEKLYTGARDKHGHQFVPAGLPVGSEMRWPVPSTPNGTSMAVQMALPALQSVLIRGGKQNLTRVSDFAFDYKNFIRINELSPLYNATNINLNAYKATGGKLILWHGLADDSITPASTVAYFNAVQKFMGADQVDSFMRLFLLPGVGHCGNGEGPDQIDLLTSLMAWTEDNNIPNVLFAGKRVQVEALPSPELTERTTSSKDAAVTFHGVEKPSIPVADKPEKVTMIRPVYPFPYIARFNGKGDVNDPKNYHAVKSNAYGQIKLSKPVSEMLKSDNQQSYHVVDGKLQTE